MSNRHPLVSVIIPVYNGQDFLAEAVESIRAQDYRPLEIIVVDDGSSDGTAELIAALGEDVRHISQRNCGPAAARNRGLEIAMGEFIAFLDADDLWPGGKLRLQIEYLLDHPECQLVTGRIQIITSSHPSRFHPKFERPDSDLSVPNFGAMVCRRRLFQRLGSLDESLWYSEDQDWFLRVREEGIPIPILEQVTLLYRLHGGNMTLNRELPQFQLTQALKKSLDRRRKNTGVATQLPQWSGCDEKQRPAKQEPMSEDACQSSAHAEMAVKSAHRISVVIPLFNSERYVAEAIESVLGQTYAPSQVIVVDDGSTDHSRDIVQRYLPRVEYVWQPNAGVGAARNRGVGMAAGELLAFLDDDDRWLPDKLSRQLAALTEDPARDMVTGYVRQFISPDIELSAAKRVCIPPEPMPGWLPGAMLIKKGAFLRVGFFQESCRMGESIDWYCRAQEKGVKGFTIPDVVLERRVHDANSGITHRDARADYVRILKAALDRRRGIVNATQ